MSREQSRVRPLADIQPARSPWLWGVPGLTWPLLVTGVLWLASAVGAYVMTRVRGVPVVLCPLKNLTGWPCPTCGGTRAGVALLSGDPLRAITMNPFVTVLLLAAPAWIVWRVATGRAMSARSASRAWVIVGTLLLVNWVYVLWRHSTVGEP